MKKINIIKFGSAILAVGALALGLAQTTPVRNEEFQKRKLEQKVTFNRPIKTVQVSPGIPNKDSRTALYLQIKEWGDYSQKSFTNEEQTIVFSEPEGYTAAKWNALLNPTFCKQGGPQGGYSTAQQYYTDRDCSDMSHEILYNNIDFHRDKIVYSIFEDPKDMFEYLKEFKGKKVDRVVISSHGSHYSLSQESPTQHTVYLEDLLKRYKPADFDNVLAPNGEILLQACATNKEYKDRLTIAEGISYLFNSPTTGALKDATFFTGGLIGPSNITWDPVNHNPLVAEWFKTHLSQKERESSMARWYRTDGTPDLQNVTFTPFKTVYPDKTRPEVEKYLAKYSKFF